MSTNGYLDKVVESEPVREVVGVVHDRVALEELEECLMESGFDRGEIDIMANDGAVDGTVTRASVREGTAPEAIDSERHEVLTHDDHTGAHVLAYGTLISIGGMVAAIPMFAVGAAPVAIAASVVAGGAIGGGIGRFVRNRIIGHSSVRELEDHLYEEGIAVMVRVRDPLEESKARMVMNDCGADRIHSHDVELKKTLHEIPLAAMKPDPWLSPQRLGG